MEKEVNMADAQPTVRRERGGSVKGNGQWIMSTLLGWVYTSDSMARSIAICSTLRTVGNYGCFCVGWQERENWTLLPMTIFTSASDKFDAVHNAKGKSTDDGCFHCAVKSSPKKKTDLCVGILLTRSWHVAMSSGLFDLLMLLHV